MSYEPYPDAPAKAVEPKRDTSPYCQAVPDMPYDFEGLSFIDRVRCALQYHAWEQRHAVDNPKVPGMRLRDQCGRCGALR